MRICETEDIKHRPADNIDATYQYVLHPCARLDEVDRGRDTQVDVRAIELTSPLELRPLFAPVLLETAEPSEIPLLLPLHAQRLELPYEAVGLLFAFLETEL